MTLKRCARAILRYAKQESFSSRLRTPRNRTCFAAVNDRRTVKLEPLSYLRLEFSIRPASAGWRQGAGQAPDSRKPKPRLILPHTVIVLVYKGPRSERPSPPLGR